MKKKDVEKQYETKIPMYEKLGKNLSEALTLLLNEESIQFLKVYYRIKKSDSFIGKITRKNSTNPFEEIEDICGIRIICYYKSDIDRICDVINNEFEVLASEDKEELLKPDQFGYRSHHFIVKIKEDWLVTPNYKGIGDLKAEIQIRTNLMHTWAEIEHEFGYKKEEDIPKKFRRDFSLLSASLELADKQFETLKQDINTYREQNKIKYIKENELNLDTLQAFLDDYFPTRQRSEQSTSELVTELKKLDISISNIINSYKKCKDLLPDLEESENYIYRQQFQWSQVGIVRTILGLTQLDYLETNLGESELFEINEKYRKMLK